MATNTAPDHPIRTIIGKWNTGVGAGIAGVIPMILFNTVVLGKDLFPLFGLIPFAVLWGLLYAGIATINRIQPLATDPLTGLLMGVVYSFVVWIGLQIGEPGVFAVNRVVQVVVFGVFLGLTYAYSPVVD